MGTTEYLHYDQIVDHLTVYRSDEKIISNLDLGLAIISFNAKKQIMGVEFVGAHTNFKIPLDVLKNINSCAIDVRYVPSQKTVIISAVFHYQKQESPLVWSHAGVDLGVSPITEHFSCSIA